MYMRKSASAEESLECAGSGEKNMSLKFDIFGPNSIEIKGVALSPHGKMDLVLITMWGGLGLCVYFGSSGFLQHAK